MSTLRHADGDMVNCEQVEEHVSAYHDGMLDAANADMVRNHLATCARCSAMLADFEEIDQILAKAPRVIPGPELRDRIFSSPEFREIVRSQQPGASKTPSTPVNMPQRPRLGPQAARVWLPVLVLIMVLGSTTAVISRILASRASGPAYATCPTLGSGSRLVYHSGKTLYSNDAPLVCDTHAQVGLWQVSPDGHWIAYLNDSTHTLRLVRSDATQDHQITLSAGDVQSLTWTPDSQRVIFAQTAPTSPNETIRFMTADINSSDAKPIGVIDSKSLTSSLIVSPDSQYIAVAALLVDGPHTSAIFTMSTAPKTVIRANTGRIDFDSPITHLSWLNDTDPILTWVTGIGMGDGSIGRIHASAIATPPYNPQVNSVGDITVAAFSPASGQWAVASTNGTVSTIDAASGTQTPLAALSGVTALAPSPDGTQWLVTSAQTLWLLNDDGVIKLTDGLSAIPPAWLGTRVVFATNGAVQIASVQANKVSLHAADAKGVGTVVGFAPTTDGSALAICGNAGTAIVAPTGAQRSLFTHIVSGAPQWTT